MVLNKRVLVSAVVVNFNARDFLLRCVSSLQAALATIASPTEIIVVDNGSTDDSLGSLLAAAPEVRVVSLTENRGFAGGANAGIEVATGAWVLLLNNDAIIEPQAVSELLAAAADKPRIGLLAAQMLFAANGRINSAGLGVDRLGVAFERAIGEPRERAQPPTPVFGASAGAALMRRTMLEQLGGFDASFFLYLEDVDLAWRAQMSDWECLYVPSAVVHHHHSVTSTHGSPFKYFFVGRNRVCLLAKHMPTRDLVRRAPAIIAYDLAYCLFVALTDRTLTPVRGRIVGLRHWRTYRRLGAATRRRIELAPIQGLGRALERRRGVITGGYVADQPSRRATTMS